MNTNKHKYEWISFSYSSWPIGNKDPVRLIRVSTKLNMDTQDAQDKQDERLLQRKLTHPKRDTGYLRGKGVEDVILFLCIHVKNLFADQTPELEWRHFVSLVDFFFPFLDNSFLVCCFRQAARQDGEA